MKHLVKRLVAPAYRKYRDLYDRVTALETAMNCVVRDDTWRLADEIGFNGQARRKEVFHELRRLTAFDAVVETGTWIGNTTGFWQA